MEFLAQPMRIGRVEVPNRVFLAPMSGISDLPFRTLAAAHGAGLVVSEMVASRELCKSDVESRKRAALNLKSPGPGVVQLAGCDAHWMGEAARIAEGVGADIIDINMGCPAKKVVGGLSGSALMRDLDHALTLIKATVCAVNVPVTLKMRLGWDAETINAPELARRAEDAGITMITVHGRTRSQFYEGDADWRAVAAVRAKTGLPLVINGDIIDLDTARQAIARSGADAVMIGRAAYGRPWLPGCLSSVSGVQAPWRLVADSFADYVVEHYLTMLSHYGSQVGVRHARKHLGWYADAHVLRTAKTGALRANMMRSANADEVVDAIRCLFEEGNLAGHEVGGKRLAA